jgi:hypothetical protein
MTINKKTRDNQIELNFKINETFYRKKIKKNNGARFSNK